MSKKNIFKDKDEKVINKKNLSINDFNRKVVLIKTNKKQYVIKSGRNTLIEKKILDFFNKYADFEFFPKEYEYKNKKLIIKYYDNIQLNKVFNNTDIRKYYINLAKIFNFFLDKKNNKNFKDHIKISQVGFYKNRTINDYQIIIKPYAQSGNLSKNNIKMKRFISEFEGICDLDFSFNDLYIVNKKLYFFDFEYFASNNILLMIFQSLLPLVNYNNQNFNKIIEHFINLLNINVSAKNILKNLFINNINDLIIFNDLLIDFFNDFDSNKKFYEFYKQYSKDIITNNRFNQKIKEDFNLYLIFILFSYIYIEKLKIIDKFRLNNKYLNLFINKKFKNYQKELFSLPIKGKWISIKKVNKYIRNKLNDIYDGLIQFLDQTGYSLRMMLWRGDLLEIFLEDNNQKGRINLIINKQDKYFYKSKNFNISYKGEEAENDLKFIKKISEYLAEADKKNNYNIFH